MRCDIWRLLAPEKYVPNCQDRGKERNWMSDDLDVEEC